jgi:hypothetical protein
VNRPAAFALGLVLGALASPLAQVLASRYAGRHWLDVITEETP